ncbi:hypothetical protein AB0K09_25915 [Streptomyces sp. NPDC049577]|uniref:hypothetical protein n=1 Tax=Streptomyces sp. NPDC049577 TaxID=3155153 RepID=UPI00343C382F
MKRPSSRLRLLLTAVLTALLTALAPAAVADSPHHGSAAGDTTEIHCPPGTRCNDTSWGG